MSDVKTYELSKVQEEIWNKHGQDAPSLGILFQCDKRMTEEGIQAIWNQLAEIHQVLVTELEFSEQSTRPFQKISNDSNVEILEVGGKNGDNLQAKFRQAFEKQSTELRGWIVLFENKENTSKIIIGATSLLADKWSLIELVSGFLNIIQGNTLEEVLPYVQFSEWHKNALEDEDVEAKRFWEERVQNHEQKNKKDKEEVNNYQSSITISSGSKEPSETICYAIAATTLMSHQGDEKLHINYVNDGRYFEELNPIVGPFSLTCPLEIINKEISRLFPIVEDELEEQKSTLASYIPKPSSITPDILFEYWKSNDELQNGWNFEETNQTEDVKFEFVESQHQITLTIRYQSEKYDSKYIESLSEQVLGRIKSYLEQGASNDGVLSPEILERIHKVSSGKQKEINPNFIFERLESADANAQAISFEGNAITYGELRNAVDNLAASYRNQGVESNTKIGLYLPGNVHYVISVLSLWKLGAVVIPISKTAPLGRLESCLKLANASHVISDTEIGISESDIALVISDDLNINIPESKIETIKYNGKTPAYILFTSGSTGEPKGCQISHYNLSNYLSWASKYYLNDDSKLAHFPFFTSVGFDFTFTSVLLPLVNSGCVWIQDTEKSFDEHLVSIAKNENLGYVKLTPSHIRVLQSVEVDQFLPNNVILGGEALTNSQIEFLEKINPDIKIYNEYGPTEATIGCVVTQVTSKDKSVPIGVPIDNTSIHLINEEGKQLPEYCIGQLAIVGDSLSEGYINSALNTSFQEAGEVIKSRHYHTGDIGYRDASGQLFFHGRKDNQVKIRGNRIELSEITIAAESHEAVEQAIVDVDESSESIILYVKTSESDVADDLELWLQNQLMPYALPSNIVEITHIPLNENGKADLKELRNMNNATSEDIDLEALEMMPSYQVLSRLWKEVLKVDQVHPNDHFIKAGGDSIKAIQLVNKLRQEGYEVNIRGVLEFPILGKLSEHLANKESDENTLEFEKDEGEIMLNPNQLNFLEYSGNQVNGYCQSICVKIPEKVEEETFQKTIDFVLSKHPMLNAKFTVEDGEYKQTISEETNVSAIAKYLTEDEFISERKQQPIYELIDVENGPLTLFYLVKKEDEYNLYIYTHHLIMDAVSWRILIEDIQSAFQTYKNDINAELKVKTEAYFGARTFALENQSEEDTSFWDAELEYLKNQDSWLTGPFLYKNFEQVEFFMNDEVSNRIKGVANDRYETQPIELLLTAIARAYKKINKTDFSCIMENNGRQSIHGTPDVEGSIGWFTSMYPITVSVSDLNELDKDINHVSEKYNSIPDNGIYFSYQHGHSTLPTIQVNYLGVNEFTEDGGFQVVPDPFADENIHPELDIRIGLGFSIVFGENGLHFVMSYDSEKISDKWLQEFSESLQSELVELSAYCVRELELIDKLDYKGLDDGDLEDILGDL